ncbi:ABC transporter permease [Rhizobium sp. IMFF44]|uniref:ABC transporter permease n=1 Tax=Rhizobium sp. IMFF44 TaxID=3342350 RepID=UPI0035B70E64
MVYYQVDAPEQSAGGFRNRNDICQGILASHIWLALGWHDIRQRYRRSIIGPFWFTLSTLIMVSVLGLLYSTLLKQNISDYLPYLGAGLVIWQFISGCINEGCNAFITAGYLIRQVRMPLTVHVCRVVWRNFVILLHSLPVLIVFLFLFGHYPTFGLLLLLPALVVVFLQGIWVSIVLGILCTRYRDVLPIIANLLQIVFFFTPIMWSKDLLRERGWLADFNPIYHVIEIARAPLVGKLPDLASWYWSGGLLIAGFLLAQVMMKRARGRVPYWL